MKKIIPLTLTLNMIILLLAVGSNVETHGTVTPFAQGGAISPVPYNPDTSRYVRRDSILVPISSAYIPLERDVTFADTMLYSPAFLPPVYNFKILPERLNLYPTESSAPETIHYHLKSSRGILYQNLQQWNRVHDIRRHFFITHPELVEYNLTELDALSPIKKQQVVAPTGLSQDIIGRRGELSTEIALEKTVAKRVYWTKTGEHALQVNQNQFSDNWYAGGNNNFNLMSYHKLQFNYAKNKITWNNTVEWKLSFLRTPADTLHNFSITEDFLRYYTVAGIKASSKWSYTFTNEVKTSLFNTYKTNAVRKSSALFSPLYVNTGIGMAYNHTHTYPTDKNRKLILSLDLSPLSFNYTFVGDSEVDETNFGISAGRKYNRAFGSTYNVNLSYSHNRDVHFTSRLQYFTSYSRVIVESENRLNFSFTRLLSSSAYFYLRYDDGIAASKKDDKWGYWQYKEVLGFGLTYKW